MEKEKVIIDLSLYHGGQSTLAQSREDINRALEANKDNEVILTGEAPVWMYLLIGHAMWQGNDKI